MLPCLHLFAPLLAAALFASLLGSSHAHGLHYRERGHYPPRHNTYKHGSFYKPLNSKYGPPRSSYRPSSSYDNSYESASYEKPSYEAPSYGKPSYKAPSYEKPSYEAPSYEEHKATSYEAPSYEAPSYEAPSYEAPSYEAPSYEAPTYAPKPEVKHEVSYGEEAKPIRYKPHGECTFRGQYLRDPSNKCNYRRCVVQSEPWEVEGEIPLDIITQPCAPGTSVSNDFHAGEDNPCVNVDETCLPPVQKYTPAPAKPQPSYNPAPTYKPAPKYEAPEPQSECKAHGMHLPGTSKCNYRRCVIQSEPWEVEGEIPLDIISLDCPPGTAVPHSYKGGYDTPCTVFDNSCGAQSYQPPAETPSYSEPKKEEPKTYPAPEPPKYKPAPQPKPAPRYEPAPQPKPAPKYEPAPTYAPKSECLARGMHLPGTSKCNYRRCVVQSEPWEVEGEIPLDVISLDCPPGTAVPHSYKGGYDTPCTVFDSSCGAPDPVAYTPPTKTPKYPEPEQPRYEEPETPSYEEPEMPSYEEPEAPSYEEPEAPSYEEPEAPNYYEEPEEPPKSSYGCHHRGQHLRDPEDKCRYQRCVVKSEPWVVAGKIPLDVVSLMCAPGSAVPTDYKGGYANPCTVNDKSCLVPAKVSYH